MIRRKGMSDCYSSSECAEKGIYTYLHATWDATIGSDLKPAVAQNDQWLIVSNAPESIEKKSTPQTLYKYTSQALGGDMQSIRVYIWHINHGSDAVDISLRISCDEDDGGVLINYKSYEVGGANLADILTPGMCLAEHQLYEDLNPHYGTYFIPSDGSELELWEHTIPAAPMQKGRYSLTGSIHEFDISLLQESVTIRIAAKGASSWGSPTDSVVPPENPNGVVHNRGWWPYSKIMCEAEDEFDFSTGSTPNYQQYAICESSVAKDSIMFAWQGSTLDPYGCGNKGCYGANLLYKLPATSGELGGVLYVGMHSRNVIYKYAGAAIVRSPEVPGHPLPPKDVPKYPCDFGNQVQQNMFNLLQFRYGGSHISKPPDQEFDVIVEVVNAGAAALPTNLFLSKINPSVD